MVLTKRGCSQMTTWPQGDGGGLGQASMTGSNMTQMGVGGLGVINSKNCMTFFVNSPKIIPCMISRPLLTPHSPVDVKSQPALT